MSREGNWLIMENRVRDGDILLPAERLSRSEHFVENDTQGPQVSASVCGLASDLLRGHIRHCRKTRSWFAQTLIRSEEHTSELQSLAYLVCRLLLEKKKNKYK